LNHDNLNNDNTGEALQVVDLVDVEFEIEIVVINVFGTFL
jgi:hypothetical protein